MNSKLAEVFLDTKLMDILGTINKRTDRSHRIYKNKVVLYLTNLLGIFGNISYYVLAINTHHMVLNYLALVPFYSLFLISAILLWKNFWPQVPKFLKYKDEEFEYFQIESAHNLANAAKGLDRLTSPEYRLIVLNAGGADHG